MSLELRSRILAELDSLILIDPHTHINALAPASTTLADILGYHYYTELAHSAGLPREQIENAELEPRDKVRLLIENLAAVDNTVQYGWFVEICQTLMGFQEERITQDNWESLYDHSVELMAGEHWSQQVLEKSRLQAVFLTNDFDDPLERSRAFQISGGPQMHPKSVPRASWRWNWLQGRLGGLLGSIFGPFGVPQPDPQGCRGRTLTV